MFFIYICIEMEDICIIDCTTTHYFKKLEILSQLTNKTNLHVWTVSGTSYIIEVSEKLVLFCQIRRT